jgi:hypothetical protein
VTITAGGSVGARQFTGGSYNITVSFGSIFFFKGAGVQVTGGSAMIEVSHAGLQFQGSSDGRTAAYLLDNHADLGLSAPNVDNVAHLGSLDCDSTSTVVIIIRCSQETSEILSG